MIAGSRATLSQNQIYSNVGQVNGALGTGGGLIILNSHVDMQANIIFSNTAVLTLTGSGAQAYGGGLYVSGSTLTMTGNLVQGNAAAFNIGPSPSSGIEVQGGGLYVEDSDFLLRHNQIRVVGRS